MQLDGHELKVFYCDHCDSDTYAYVEGDCLVCHYCGNMVGLLDKSAYAQWLAENEDTNE